jgi:hypothetical protein
MDKKLTELKNHLQHLLKKIGWINDSSKIKLHYLAGINRAINPGQVTKLCNSLMKMGNIRPVIVCEIDFLNGIKGHYILDGQHLFNALLRLGWDIPYVMIDVKDKQDLVEKIALLNSSSKSWSMQDYVLAWASLKPDYIKLNKYFQIFDIEISILAAILSNGTVGSAGTITKTIKDGEFAIQDEEANISIVNGITDVLKFIPRMNRFENRYVCAEYVNFRRTEGCSYDHKAFMKKLEANKKQFILATQEQQKLSDMFRKLSK